MITFLPYELSRVFRALKGADLLMKDLKRLTSESLAHLGFYIFMVSVSFSQTGRLSVDNDFKTMCWQFFPFLACQLSVPCPWIETVMFFLDKFQIQVMRKPMQSASEKLSAWSTVFHTASSTLWLQRTHPSMKTNSSEKNMSLIQKKSLHLFPNTLKY